MIRWLGFEEDTQKDPIESRCHDSNLTHRSFPGFKTMATRNAPSPRTVARINVPIPQTVDKINAPWPQTVDPGHIYMLKIQVKLI